MKTKTVTLIEVDYKELDDQITKFLTEKKIKWPYSDHRFEIVAEHEWGNDECHSFTVDGEIDEDEKQRIMEGNLGWQANIIMNWMAAENVIPKGEYKIDICW